MIYLIIALVIVIYVIGIYVYCGTETIEYKMYNNRDLTPNDVRKSLIWPILFIILLIKTPIWLLNESIIPFILLIFGIYYKDTKMYERINKII